MRQKTNSILEIAEDRGRRRGLHQNGRERDTNGHADGEHRGQRLNRRHQQRISRQRSRHQHVRAHDGAPRPAQLGTQMRAIHDIREDQVPAHDTA